MAKIIDDETMENVCILSKLSLSEEEKEKAKEAGASGGDMPDVFWMHSNEVLKR